MHCCRVSRRRLGLETRRVVHASATARQRVHAVHAHRGPWRPQHVALDSRLTIRPRILSSMTSSEQMLDQPLPCVPILYLLVGELGREYITTFMPVASYDLPVMVIASRHQSAGLQMTRSRVGCRGLLPPSSSTASTRGAWATPASARSPETSSRI